MSISVYRCRVLPILLTVLSAPATAQFLDQRALEGDPAVATVPMAPRLDGLGERSRPVTTRSPDSQAYFDQGLALVWAFNHSEAVRAFKEAARLDPGNAMAYWGWALALGPNLNLPMQPEAIAPAHAAIRRALTHTDTASPLEQALIRALASRYSQDPSADRAGLDLAYAKAMAQVVSEYPDDADVLTLYADALMNLSPWDYWYRDGSPRTHTVPLIEALETVLAMDPDHPGALHLHIHAEEAWRPERAEASADRLLQAMPAAGHLVHMPSHIYMRVGRYADAYEANVLATAADESYLEQCRTQGIYPLLYYPHNIHFMVWAAMLQGQSEVALRDARAMADITRPHLGHSVPGLDEHFQSQPLYVMTRFGQWPALLSEPPPPAEARFMTAIWHYGRGLALRFSDDRRAAERELRALERIAGEAAFADLAIGFASAPVLLEISMAILRGEIAASRGRYGDAIAKLEHAVRLQDGLPYNEPPDWFFPARHYLGALLLEAGRPAEAETVYWQDLQRNPANGYALHGLLEAQLAQDREDDAEATRRRLSEAWAAADTVLQSSRY